MGWKNNIKMSASAADRWFTCRASAVLEAQNPWTRNTESSPFAAEGTLAHEVAEYEVRKRFFLGDIPKPSMEDTTGEMWHHAEKYAEYVENLTDDKNSEVWHFTEQRVSLDKSPHVRGIADYIGIDPEGRAYVIDYKYGAGVPVAVEGNKQLMVYGVAALQLADSLGVELETITIAVYQPRVFGGISDFTYSAKELRDFHSELVEADFEISHPENFPEYLTFKKSDKACRWCPIKDYCRELINPNRIKEIMEKLNSIKDYEALSIEELEEVYALSKEAKDIHAQAEKAIRARLLKGEKGQSLKAVQGIKRLDPEAYSAWLDNQIMLGTVTEEQAFTRKPVTQTELKKIVDKDVAKEIASLPKTEGAPRIVDIDAKGTELGGNKAGDFFKNIF